MPSGIEASYIINIPIEMYSRKNSQQCINIENDCVDVKVINLCVYMPAQLSIT